ncbi:hypothetical protein HWV62_29284 [Athelia sp. TMB]|nr:hypothetical protein HWV62_29284 [Athelia sp. TMB]
MSSLSFAYYCSGHGFGHATRVSAFASHLLALAPKPTVYLISSAPKYVFADSVAAGAVYRFSEIDPVIVQPLAYRVDRQKSVDVLRAFLDTKDAKLEEERAWLQEMGVDCVLSDAAFLGCLAANAARIPSILITNFTFDSVYSYLSAPVNDDPTTEPPPPNGSPTHLRPPSLAPALVPDAPIPQGTLAPLVAQIHAGYRCADLLLLLPGAIPIPSFAAAPALPSPAWIDWATRGFAPPVAAHLTDMTAGAGAGELLAQIPFAPGGRVKRVPRAVQRAPLLVRTPTPHSATTPSVFTRAGRAALLASIGVPAERHDPATTRVLVVSFGGQVFKRVASRPRSALGMRAGGSSANGSQTTLGSHSTFGSSAWGSLSSSAASSAASSPAISPLTSPLRPPKSPTLKAQTPPLPRLRLATDSHLFIPGAPPAALPGSPGSPRTRVFPPSQPGTPRSAGVHRVTRSLSSYFGPHAEPVEEKEEEEGEGEEGWEEEAGGLLPDASWIAVVCGVSKEQWDAEDGGGGLPAGFYVAPKDVYMPDLTAVADVLLGKLGYGTVAECVDAATPFVYVSRPLFIEEHGLKLLLTRSGVGVELARADYEAGEWAAAVGAAYQQGRALKAARTRVGAAGAERRKAEGREMAEGVVGWVARWWAEAGETR